MPNWCFNELIVQGDYQEFKEKLLDGFKLQFETFFPLPEEEKENWYQWRVENWGTKWDIISQHAAEFDDRLEFNFDTAWTPCLAFVEKLSAMFPDLKFTLRYYEIMDCFAGASIFKAGEELDEFFTQDHSGIQQFIMEHYDFDPFEDENED